MHLLSNDLQMAALISKGGHNQDTTGRCFFQSDISASSSFLLISEAVEKKDGKTCARLLLHSGWLHSYNWAKIHTIYESEPRQIVDTIHAFHALQNGGIRDLFYDLWLAKWKRIHIKQRRTCKLDTERSSRVTWVLITRKLVYRVC